MKTIAFHLQKGGVGKTTLSGTIAHELKKHANVILIDCDPQANSSSWHLQKSPTYELADVLQGRINMKDAIIDVEGLSLIPTFGLDGGLKLYGETKLNDEPFILIDLVEEIEKMGYEYAIFDLSPGMGRLEKAALIAANEVITPMTPEYFGLDGIEIFSSELEKLKKNFRKGPSHKKIIINAYDSRIGQHIEIGEKTKNYSTKYTSYP